MRPKPINRFLLAAAATFAIAIAWIGTLPSASAKQWHLLPGAIHDVELTEQNETFQIRTTGSDPYLTGRLAEPPKKNDRILEFEYFCPSGIKGATAYLGPPISEASRVDLPDLPIAEGWQTYTADLQERLGKPIPQHVRLLRLDLGVQSDRRIQIRGLHLRAMNAREIEALKNREARDQAKRDDAERIANYLADSQSDSFTVDVTGDEIVFEFLHGIEDAESCELEEFKPNQSIADQNAEALVRVELTQKGSSWVGRLPRVVGNYDRVCSGWRLARIGENRATSPRRYPRRIASAVESASKQELVPLSQKGLSGFSPRGPKQDLIDLGIRGVTINLVLNRFVTRQAGPGREKIDVAGEPVYFDARIFDHYDRMIDFARMHDIVVSAIVLIPRSKNAASRSPLVHPEAEGGVYAMPDLKTSRGASIYRHVLERIAQRYNNHEASPGEITNWIVHNEVDFHPVWTNMGRQPREVYTEAYYRSMRLIHNVARKHNPHARVFVSLTHHWVVPDDGKWKQLAPREVIETLQRYSEIEGDFAWGVAYHPYPQSLFAKVAWQDKNISGDFETPLITIQNLEVLGKFLSQRSMRNADGNLRPVILSEQGFHSHGYEADALADQAGSLAYTMKRIAKMPWIETFHYHRWIDHPDEGGLLVGLRTLPTPEHRFGKPKQAWHVYRAIGTADEDKATKGLPSP